MFIHFGAANYFTRVYLNGEALGEHEGGFTPFNFEVTDKIHEGDNFVVVEVNNARRRDAVPSLNTDWWNYGGLTREVNLVEVPETLFRITSSSSPKVRAMRSRAGCNLVPQQRSKSR